MNLEVRIYHALLGLAYGDSLGMPTENYTRQQIQQKFGDVTRLLPSGSENLVAKNLPAGATTDDTANSLFVAKMLIENKGKIDKQIFMDSLIHWLDTDETAASVTGPSTMAAVEAVKSGTSIDEAGKTGTTNGAAMKIGPMGLVYDYRNLRVLVEMVAEICVPTHNTQIAIQGAAVVAVSVSYFFRNEQINWSEFYSLIIGTAKIAGEYGNSVPTPDIIKRISYGKRMADKYSESAFLDDLYGFLGTGLATIEMVPAAISLVYRYQGDLKQVTHVAANIGGDTDTLASICGAICGSHKFNIDRSEIALIEDNSNVNFHAVAASLSELLEGGKGKC